MNELLPLQPQPAIPYADPRFAQCINFDRSPTMIALVGVPFSRQKKASVRANLAVHARYFLYRYPDGSEALVPNMHYNRDTRTHLLNEQIWLDCLLNDKMSASNYLDEQRKLESQGFNSDRLLDAIAGAEDSCAKLDDAIRATRARIDKYTALLPTTST